MGEERDKAQGPKITLHRTCPECEEKVPAEKSRCPHCGTNMVVARLNRNAETEEGGAFATEKAGMNAGVPGGVVMIVIAGVWFYLGYQAGYIYYYPPILGVLGIVAILKGLGTRPKPRRRS